jgi:two-component system response regulator HydG
MTDCILLVHDDPAVLGAVGSRFEQAGAEVVREAAVAAALEALEVIRPDVVCIGTHLAGGALDGLTKLGGREAPVLAFGPPADSGLGTKLMLAGAARVVDGRDLDGLVALARQSAAEGRRRRVSEALIRAGSPGLGLESLGQSAAMRQLAQQIGILAQNERTTLLISGEAGAGKAWAARLIHDLGARAARPFLEVRLTGQSPADLESVIFGHEKGAFVQAAARRHGLLELADGGTLLLRDIGALPPELQPKLLRVLETRSFRRMGGTHDLTTDTRLMATTRVDLAPEVEAERFQKDLFYRLSVMTFQVPPFRDRAPDDRLAVIQAIHRDARALFPEGPSMIAPEAIIRLQEYQWPGNLREVRQVLERATQLARGQIAIGVEHLPGEFRARPGIGDRRHTPMSLDVLEHQHIERTLRYHGGNRTRAAKELGISRATLINKIKLYAISD